MTMRKHLSRASIGDDLAGEPYLAVSINYC